MGLRVPTGISYGLWGGFADGYAEVGGIRYQSLSGCDEDEHATAFAYRSEAELATEARPKFHRGAAVESRIGIGPYEGDAKKLTKTKLEAAKPTCFATPFFFAMVDHGAIPSIEERINAHAHATACHARTIAIGKDLRSRHSEESLEEGITHSHMSKQAKAEFHYNTGIKLPDNANANPNPTPILTGVPV
jgi:hypothetical protein